MPKPIAIIRFPDGFPITGDDGEKISFKDCARTTEWLDKNKPDYHWFVFISPDVTDIKFEVYYEKDFTEIQYEELKKLVYEAASIN